MWYALGQVYKSSARGNESVKCFERALVLGGQEAPLLCTIAKMYRYETQPRDEDKVCAGG